MLHLPKFTKPLAFILSVITLSLSLGYFIFAWTEPNTAPPGGNVSTPINVSTDSQGKAGILEVTELKDYNDNTYFIDPSAAVSAKLSGDVQIGTNVTIKGDGNLSTGLNADKIDGIDSADLMAAGGGAGSGVTWKGYTGLFDGNMGGIKGMNSKCDAGYSGSHACTYDEIMALGSAYPWADDAWAIDGLLLGPSNYYGYTKDLAWWGSVGNWADCAGLDNTGCKGWTTAGGCGNASYYDKTRGTLYATGCGVTRKIPCCCSKGDCNQSVSDFSFTNQTGVGISQSIQSNEVTLSGTFSNLTASCGAGCTDIAKNGIWAGATVLAGFNTNDTITIKQLSSSNYNIATTATVVVGSKVSGTWTVTTGFVNAFSFTDQTGVSTNSTTPSDVVALAGTFSNLTATCNAGCTDIAKNGIWAGATTLAGFKTNDTIAIKQTSSGSNNTETTASVTIGPTSSGAWKVTTGAAQTTTWTTPGNYTWVKPNGYGAGATVNIKCWGGGAGGGGGFDNACAIGGHAGGGGGGGGGGESVVLLSSLSTSIAVTVGDKGVGGGGGNANLVPPGNQAYSGTNGGASKFGTLTANGGAGGAAGDTACGSGTGGAGGTSSGFATGYTGNTGATGSAGAGPGGSGGTSTGPTPTGGAGNGGDGGYGGAGPGYGGGSGANGAAGKCIITIIP